MSFILFPQSLYLYKLGILLLQLFVVIHWKRSGVLASESWLLDLFQVIFVFPRPGGWTHQTLMHGIVLYFIFGFQLANQKMQFFQIPLPLLNILPTILNILLLIAHPPHQLLNFLLLLLVNSRRIIFLDMLCEIILLLHESRSNFLLIGLRRWFNHPAVKFASVGLVLCYYFHLVLLQLPLLPSHRLVLIQQLVVSVHVILQILHRQLLPRLHHLIHLLQLLPVLLPPPLLELLLHLLMRVLFICYEF